MKFVKTQSFKGAVLFFSGCHLILPLSFMYRILKAVIKVLTEEMRGPFALQFLNEHLPPDKVI